MLIALLLRVLFASMPVFVSYTSLGDKPSAILSVPENAACQSLLPDANALAKSAGFGRADLSCGSVPLATFSDAGEPQTASVPNLIGFTPVITGSRGLLAVTHGFRLPSNVPYVTATADISAYVKPDALVVAVESEDPLRGAFALENAGISRADIAGLGYSPSALWVRVRPVSDAQIYAILHAVRKVYPQSRVFSDIRYVYDCGRVIRALTGLTYERARMHARTMAKAAGTTVGSLLGIVDGDGQLTDGICGGSDRATLDDLLKIRNDGPGDESLRFGAYVTVRRWLTAAWRLNIPAQNRSAVVSEMPVQMAYGRRANDAVNAFISNAPQVEGDAILRNTVQPDRAYVVAPEWTYSELRARYGRAASYLIAFSPMRAGVAISSSSSRSLADRAAEVSSFLDGLAAKTGKTIDHSVLTSRADCTGAQEAALFAAAKAAVANLHGRPLRYLKQSLAGVEGDVPCGFSPLVPLSDPQPEGALSTGFSLASVLAGY